jgi:hypothetical protein
LRLLFAFFGVNECRRFFNKLIALGRGTAPRNLILAVMDGHTNVFVGSRNAVSRVLAHLNGDINDIALLKGDKLARVVAEDVGDTDFAIQGFLAVNRDLDLCDAILPTVRDNLIHSASKCRCERFDHSAHHLGLAEIRLATDRRKIVLYAELRNLTSLG